MFKQILERKYFNKRYSSFYYGIPKLIECISKNPISYSKLCNDIAIDIVENKFLLCGFNDGNIIIYNVEEFINKAPSQVFSLNRNSNSTKSTQTIKCIQWYPVDSGLFFSCSTDKKVKLWDTNSGKCVEQVPLSYNTNWISLSPCSKSINVIAVGCDGNRTILIDIVSGSSTHVLTNNTNEPVQAVQWSNREENILATGDQGGRVSIWDVRATKKALFHLDQYQDRNSNSFNNSNCQAHGGAVRGLEFSPDGLSIATVGSEGRVLVWDMFSNRGKLMALNFGRLSEPEKISRHVRFCWTGYSNYRKIWIPSNLDVVRLSLDDGSIKRFSSLHFDQIISCVWNSGYHQLYTTGLDSNILSWNPVLQIK